MARPGATDRSRSDALIERAAEIGAGEAAIDSARSGTGELLLVEGPAGIGKSALLRAYAERASEGGFLVLTARGGALERDLPWVAARDLFSAVPDPATE